MVGTGNADGMMVPDGWYPGYANQASQQMVSEYVAQYGGSPSGVNADVAEAYSVGQVIAQAVTATGGLDNAKIINEAMLRNSFNAMFVNLSRRSQSLIERLVRTPRCTWELRS